MNLTTTSQLGTGMEPFGAIRPDNADLPDIGIIQHHTDQALEFFLMIPVEDQSHNAGFVAGIVLSFGEQLFIQLGITFGEIG